MPAFTAVGAYVAGTLLGLAGTAAIVVGAVVATGAAYITSRIINGNQNKGNNSAATQGGRIQVPPATNNKIPVVYGSAYVNGIITDARLKSIGGTNNDTMYYCLVLSEYTNNLTTPSYGIESVVWNDLRLTAVDATTNAHKVKDGRKIVNGAVVTAGAFVTGTTYIITKRGTTNFTLIGAQTNNIGQVFTATGAGTGTGQAQEEDFKDEGFVVDGNSLVELRVYAGGSAATDQIYPPQSTGNTTPAYTFWGNNDSSWTSANEMDGLVFAIVKMTYATNGFTSLPNVTFQLANNIANPADVWYDYMTSKRYGAGIPAADIDSTAKTAWYNYCGEDINYTSANLDPAGGTGTADQITERYQINGIIDTSNQVKTNIDTILQNGGAWMSYNVATGLWSPVIKKAVTAGIPGNAATYFTASRSGTTLTVTAFPEGRIEAGQRLFNSAGTFVGNISAQLAPTAGETAGQIGRYTTSISGAISSTTFYTTQPTAGTLSFSDDNIISGISISSTRLEDLYNKVEVEFYDKYNKDQKAYYRTTVPSLQLNPNEPENTLRMSLDLCNNSIQSDLLGQIELRQSRDDLVIEFTSNHYGIQTQAGDIIQVTSDLYGWAPKLFRAMRVKEQETEEGGLVAQIQALEYNGDAYTIESISEFSTAANIGIGNLISSVGLPPPETPVISNPNPNGSIPNFTFNVDIPATGGPFDEIEIYFTEGWDPFDITGNIVAGTGSNGAPVGKGLMTLSYAEYNQINVGDYLSISTSGDVTIDSQILPLIGAEVLKGKGRYIVTVTNMGALPLPATGEATTKLYDLPFETDFIFLKNKVPDGNATSFASPSTVSILITELPANTATYRRYFLKSRLGNKKNFGRFSPNVPIDLDGNINWKPNPSGSGGTGLFGNITVGVTTANTINTTTGNLVLDSATNLVVVDANLQVGGFANQIRTTTNNTATPNGIGGVIATNDYWFVGGYAAGGVSNAGAMVIASGNNADVAGAAEPIYVRQMTGPANPVTTDFPGAAGVNTITNELTLLDNNGNTILPKDLAVNGGDITTTQTTASLFNTTATTVNAFGAATTTNIGLTLASDGDFPGGGSIRIDTTTTPDTITLLGELQFTRQQASSGAPYYDGPFPTLKVLDTSESHSINLLPTSPIIYMGARSSEVRIGNLDDSGYTYIAGDRLEVAGPTGLNVISSKIYGSPTIQANIFATTTGNIVIGAAGSSTQTTTINATKTIVNLLQTNTIDSVGDGDVISLITAMSRFNSATIGSNQTSTLASGANGQFKSLMKSYHASSSNMIVTVANAGWKSGSSGTITFSAVGHSCLLQYTSAAGWFAVGANGVTFA